MIGSTMAVKATPVLAVYFQTELGLKISIFKMFHVE
jgi:hypothetical protein